MSQNCGLGLKVARDPQTRKVVIDGIAPGGPADASGNTTFSCAYI